MDPQEKWIALIAALTVMICVSGVGACTYFERVALPMRMAEKGFCQVPVIVPGGNTQLVWQPCPPKAGEGR
ncbi:MAG TPA: hypothetical protein VEI97_11285 [bacterium]|nr:hypothetical protein [bacterium]